MIINNMYIMQVIIVLYLPPRIGTIILAFESPQVPTMEQLPWQPGPMKTIGSTNVSQICNNIMIIPCFMLILSLPLSPSPSLSPPLPPAPQFVSMYEIDEHIYVFFSEEAVEANQVRF